MKEYVNMMLLLCCPFMLFAQQELFPPILDLEGIDINWVFLAKDTGLQQTIDISSVTQYSSGKFRKMICNKDHVYIFNQSLNSNVDFDGFDLYMLDKNNGALLNSLNYDYYSEAENYYMFNSLSGLNLSEEGDIEIIGYQSIDTTIAFSTFILPRLFFWGRPIKFELDVNNLTILDIQTGSNSNENLSFRHNLISTGTGDLIKDKNGDYIHLVRSGILEDGFAKNVVHFYYVDETFTIDSSKFSRIDYETNIETTLLELTSGTYYKQLDDSTLLTLSYTKALPEVSQSPEAAFMNIWTYNSYDDVSLKSSTDVTSLFVKDDNIYNFYLDTLADNLILSQVSSDLNQSETNLNIHSWIACFGSDGELKYHLKNFGDNDLSYKRITPLVANDNMLIFSIVYSLPDEKGFDIFKVDLLTTEPPIKISRISQTSDDSFDFFKMLTPLKVSNNNYIFPIQGNYQYKQDDDQKRTQFIYHVSVNLGDDFLDSTAPIIGTNKIAYSLFPNPVVDHMTIEFEELFDGHVEVYSPNGVLLFDKELKNETSATFDMSSLPGGVYIVKLRDGLEKILKSSVFYKM